MVALYRFVDLSAAVRYEGAELDSCLLEERALGAVLPEDQDVEPTPDPAHLPLAPPTHLSALTPGAIMVIITPVGEYRCQYSVVLIIEGNN